MVEILLNNSQKNTEPPLSNLIIFNNKKNNNHIESTTAINNLLVPESSSEETLQLKTQKQLFLIKSQEPKLNTTNNNNININITNSCTGTQPKPAALLKKNRKSKPTFSKTKTSVDTPKDSLTLKKIKVDTNKPKPNGIQSHTTTNVNYNDILHIPNINNSIKDNNNNIKDKDSNNNNNNNNKNVYDNNNNENNNSNFNHNNNENNNNYINSNINDDNNNNSIYNENDNDYNNNENNNNINDDNNENHNNSNNNDNDNNNINDNDIALINNLINNLHLEEEILPIDQSHLQSIVDIGSTNIPQQIILSQSALNNNNNNIKNELKILDIYIPKPIRSESTDQQIRNIVTESAGLSCNQNSANCTVVASSSVPAIPVNTTTSNVTGTQTSNSDSRIRFTNSEDTVMIPTDLNNNNFISETPNQNIVSTLPITIPSSSKKYFKETINQKVMIDKRVKFIQKLRKNNRKVHPCLLRFQEDLQKLQNLIDRFNNYKNDLKDIMFQESIDEKPDEDYLINLQVPNNIKLGFIQHLPILERYQVQQNFTPSVEFSGCLLEIGVNDEVSKLMDFNHESILALYQDGYTNDDFKIGVVMKQHITLKVDTPDATENEEEDS
ncbi:hypothetical protein DLAC_09256 [Tieghemostelium lacteum]|uniref:Uncharacterized protein n=1 Tax=Tieghemostelium lacteum TaxID=361077 RepID=A0A151Z9J6_TIELA|nr:hypothetical protein DLAC_09256 [Tieghemostelium lacteum]|eukprot:KYQ90627.1 hypothetical protein DLAC_09256 [Tieghemostelium lacteum]